MHKTVIDPHIRARFTSMKGGRDYAFGALRPDRTAQLVVDMQNGFVEEGAMLEVPTAREIVPNINAISAALREVGGLNVFLRFTTSKTSDWAVYFEQFQSTEFGRSEVADFQAGSHAHSIYSNLQVGPQDVLLDKTRFSAFTQGSSDTLDLLRRRGIDTVLVSGTLTDCCCEATARDAMQLGFRVIFLSDANAALTDNEHNAAINSLAAWYADIRPTKDVLELIRRGVNALEGTLSAAI